MSLKVKILLILIFFGAVACDKNKQNKELAYNPKKSIILLDEDTRDTLYIACIIKRETGDTIFKPQYFNDGISIELNENELENSYQIGVPCYAIKTIQGKEFGNVITMKFIKDCRVKTKVTIKDIVPPPPYPE